MDTDDIPLGGEWKDAVGNGFPGRRREYAPTLTGWVMDGAHTTPPGADTIYLNSAWELRASFAAEATLHLDSGDSRVHNSVPPLGQAALLRLAEAACDHAARVFLAGCCEYAELVREQTADAPCQCPVCVILRQMPKPIEVNLTAEESAQFHAMVEEGRRSVTERQFGVAVGPDEFVLGEAPEITDILGAKGGSLDWKEGEPRPTVTFGGKKFRLVAEGERPALAALTLEEIERVLGWTPLDVAVWENLLKEFRAAIEQKQAGGKPPC